MSKSVDILITGAAAAAAVITIVFASFTATTTIHARNTTATTTVQQEVANITKATNPTTTTISGLNASIIINAINAKIRAIYDHDRDHSNIDVPTNSNSAIITSVDNRNTTK